MMHFKPREIFKVAMEPRPEKLSDLVSQRRSLWIAVVKFGLFGIFIHVKLVLEVSHIIMYLVFLESSQWTGRRAFSSGRHLQAL